LGALSSGSLKKGLMAGLGAYGGAKLGGSLAGMGAEQAQGLAAADKLHAACRLSWCSKSNKRIEQASKS
jgi:hypothetical protein